MIRAGIPIWYTEGFNPHPKMVFTQPLPLFATSICEFLDIKIVENMPLDEIKERLNKALADELCVTDVYCPTEKFTEIAYAVYEIGGLDKITPEMLEFALAGAIEIEKKTKSGQIKMLDIRPQIRSAELKDGKLICELDASGASYLNPDLFCRGLISKLSLDADTDFSVTRCGWLKADGKEFR
jgi:radical SAM-linked protein